MSRTIYASNLALLANLVNCSRTSRRLDLIARYHDHTYTTLVLPVFPAEKPTSSDYVLESTGFSVALLLFRSPECLDRVHEAIVRLNDLCVSPG
jgi:hypothetical protein